MKRYSDRQNLARELAIFAFFVGAAVVMTWPLLPYARYGVADMGVDDVLLYARYARCFRDWVFGHSQGYLSFDMYFPSALSGATDDAALGIAVQALPLSFFIDDWLFVVNLVTFASFVLSAHAAYLLTRQISKSRGAGVVAGLVFAFGFYRLRQLDHPHILQMQWLPYALYFLHRLAEKPTASRAALFAAFLFAAETASFNIAIYSAFVFPIVGTWLVLTVPRNRARLVGWLIAVSAAVGPFLYLAYRPFLILRDAGAPARDLQEVLGYSSHIESFYAAPWFTARYGALEHNMTNEAATFMGWVVLGLVAAGLFGVGSKSEDRALFGDHRRLALIFGVAQAASCMCIYVAACLFASFKPWVRYLLGGALLGIVVFQHLARHKRDESPPAWLYSSIGALWALLSLGPRTILRLKILGDGVWEQLRLLPGFDQVRTPGRFFFVTMLCAAVIAGIGSSRIAELFAFRRARALVFAAASLLVLWDLHPAFIPLRDMPRVATAPPIYPALADAPKPGAVLELPVESSQRARQPVYYANIFRRPTVNGLSGWGQQYFNWIQYPAWSMSARGSDGILGLETLDALHIAGLRYVVIHRGWIDTRSEYRAYAHALEDRNSSKLATLGDDELWELPDPPASRRPTADDVTMNIVGLSWRERAKGEIFLNVDLVNRTDAALYSPNELRHFSTTIRQKNRVVGTGIAYWNPPLLPPYGDVELGFRATLTRDVTDGATQIEIVDDDGRVWCALIENLSFVD